MKPEHAEEHRQDIVKQFDNWVMSGQPPLTSKTGYKSSNLGHGNECNECNYAITEEMEKTRDNHFRDGLSEK